MNFPTEISYLTIGMAFLLPFGIIKYTFRKRIFPFLVGPRGMANERQLKASRNFTRLATVFLWLSPLFFAGISRGFYKYLQVDLLIAILFPGLLIATFLLEYLFQKAFYQYLLSVPKQA
jgi:hypothetical protein